MPRTIILAQIGIALAPYRTLQHTDTNHGTSHNEDGHNDTDDRDGDGGGVVALAPNQQRVVDAIVANPAQNFLVTGIAGAGKTTTIKHLAGADPLILTVDAFLSHRPDRDAHTQNKLQRVCAPQTLKQTPRIILEEIGQWPAENIQLLAKAVRDVLNTPHNDPRTFGAIQIVAVGDFDQLPPVGGDSLLSHPSLASLHLKQCFLDKSYRCDNDDDDYATFCTQLRAALQSPPPIPTAVANFIDYRLSTDYSHRSKPKVRRPSFPLAF